MIEPPATELKASLDHAAAAAGRAIGSNDLRVRRPRHAVIGIPEPGAGVEEQFRRGEMTTNRKRAMRAQLGALDERFTHQIPFTHDSVWTSDPDWRERMWFSVFDTTTGTTMLDAGMGHYPNRDVQEAWAALTIGTTQRNVRMSRRLRPAFEQMSVGPLRIEPIEPLRKLRVVLDENDSRVSFDVTLESSTRAHLEQRHTELERGVVVHDLVRYVGLVRASGWIRHPEGELRLDHDAWWGARDHSWGTQPHPRSGDGKVVAHQHMDQRGSFMNFTPMQFDGWGIFYYLTESIPGVPTYLSGDVLFPPNDPRRDLQIVGIEHDLTWKTGILKELDEGTITFLLEDGTQREVRVRGLPARVYLRAGLYQGFDGWFQGQDWDGDHFVHDVWDLADPAVVDRLQVGGGGFDHLFEARCGDQVGYGIMEYLATPGYTKYPDLQASADR